MTRIGFLFGRITEQMVWNQGMNAYSNRIGVDLCDGIFFMYNE